jgi:hypothetical protein
MPFSETERRHLLAQKGVGPTVIQRLEELGYHSFATLRAADAETIVRQAAELVGSTCWRNSPQARRAIEAALAVADKSGEDVISWKPNQRSTQ